MTSKETAAAIGRVGLETRGCDNDVGLSACSRGQQAATRATYGTVARNDCGVERDKRGLDPNTAASSGEACTNAAGDIVRNRRVGQRDVAV